MNAGADDRNLAMRVPVRLHQTTWLLPARALTGAGCAVGDQTTRLPMRTVAAVVPGKQTAPSDPGVRQAKLRRCADDLVNRTSTGSQDYARRAKTPQSRNEVKL